MKIYLYDEETMEYSHSEDAFRDPLESAKQGYSIYILPPNATYTAPILEEGMANVWNGSEWERLEDNRGKEYWLDVDTYGTPPKVMETLGKLPENIVFEAPKQTLEEAREEKLNELKWVREEMEENAIEYNYHFFDYDSTSKQRIYDAITELTLIGGIKSWTTADNEDITVNAQDLRGVIAEASKRSDSLHKHYQSLKKKLESLTTVKETKEVTWD